MMHQTSPNPPPSSPRPAQATPAASICLSHSSNEAFRPVPASPTPTHATAPAAFIAHEVKSGDGVRTSAVSAAPLTCLDACPLDVLADAAAHASTTPSGSIAGQEKTMRSDADENVKLATRVPREDDGEEDTSRMEKHTNEGERFNGESEHVCAKGNLSGTLPINISTDLSIQEGNENFHRGAEFRRTFSAADTSAPLHSSFSVNAVPSQPLPSLTYVPPGARIHKKQDYCKHFHQSRKCHLLKRTVRFATFETIISNARSRRLSADHSKRGIRDGLPSSPSPVADRVKIVDLSAPLPFAGCRSVERTGRYLFRRARHDRARADELRAMWQSAERKAQRCARAVGDVDDMIQHIAKVRSKRE